MMRSEFPKDHLPLAGAVKIIEMEIIDMITGVAAVVIAEVHQEIKTKIVIVTEIEIRIEIEIGLETGIEIETGIVIEIETGIVIEIETGTEIVIEIGTWIVTVIGIAGSVSGTANANMNDCETW